MTCEAHNFGVDEQQCEAYFHQVRDTNFALLTFFLLEYEKLHVNPSEICESNHIR